MSGVLTLPNVVSIIRLLLVPLFLWLVFAADEIGWAGALLGVIGATDWVDGYLARRLGQVSELGKLLDPLADRLALIVAVIAGLVADVLPAWFAWALIVREVLIGLGAIYGWMNGVTKLDVRWLGKAATFGLYFAITFFYIGRGFDIAFGIAAGYVCAIPGTVMYYIVGIQYFSDMRRAVATRAVRDGR
jgi:cardiolipin synthase (CMP-forming)